MWHIKVATSPTSKTEEKKIVNNNNNNNHKFPYVNDD